MADNQILDNALGFIVEREMDNDYICEQNGEWCERNCIDTLRKQCVLHFLKHSYKVMDE